MKITTLINSTLIIATIALIPGIAGAQTASEKNSSQPINTDINTNNQLKPFDLVVLAYRGYLKQEGIPSASALISGYETGSISAKALVNAAVKGNRLPAQFLNDKSYINVVEWELMSLSRDLANSNLNYEI